MEQKSTKLPNDKQINFVCRHCFNHKPRLLKIIVLDENSFGFSWLIRFSHKNWIFYALYHCDHCNGVSKYELD